MVVLSRLVEWIVGTRVGRFAALALAVLLAVGTFGAAMRGRGAAAERRREAEKRLKEYVATRRRIDGSAGVSDAASARGAFERVVSGGGFER